MAYTTKEITELRELTGAGMMDCKKALDETKGNVQDAIKVLRERGVAQAAKKSGRIAAEGAVASYIHMGGKIGVLLEVNCETDFAAGSDAFKELVHNIAMQIAAAKPEFVSKDDADKKKVEAEKNILLAQIKNEPANAKKPPQVIEKMIEGRLGKFYKSICLLEQEYVKDPAKTITDVINEVVLKTGEKISVRRFVRYELGEGIAKREDNFADEVKEQVAKAAKTKK